MANLFDFFTNAKNKVHNGLYQRLVSNEEPQESADTTSEQNIQPLNVNADIQAGLRMQPRLFNRVMSGLDNFTSGFNENLNTPFTSDNLTENTFNGSPKGLGYRLGEGMGTAARLLESPLGRAAITAGLVGASGGSGLEALAYGGQAGLINQNNRLKDNLYRTGLEKQGFDTRNLHGYIGDTTFKNLTNSIYQNQRLNQQQSIAMMKDNTARAKLIGQWLRSGEITPDVASALISAYGITDTDFQESNLTRRTNSMIDLNNARIENINNPKPKKTIKETHTTVDINHHNDNNSSNSNHGTPLGAKNSSKNKVKMSYQGKTYLVDANRVQEYINAGGEVIE